MPHETNEKPTISLALRVRPERKLIRKGGSELSIDFSIQVGPAPAQKKPERPPLKLALVLDRSGSMQGEKLSIAKRATLAVLDQLAERDKVAVVVFDDRIDIVQAVAPVNSALKSQVNKALQKIEARANTALHEGWLTGCNAIVSDAGVAGENVLARCFLLTDGIANVGVTDPERIAGEAAGVRENTGISTSTFGIGQDYNELLLGPMAVAGGGQFHHLRTPEEIFNTFVGELGELLSIAARQVRLEIELESGLSMDLISAYWMDTARLSVAIGDLQYNEEQHAIAHVRFPAQWNSERRTVRARLVWLEGKSECQTSWQELHFFYASDPACEDERPDPEVIHWASLHGSDHARREAIALNNRGDIAAARAVLHQAAQQVASSAGTDQELQDEVASLDELEKRMANAPLPAPAAKESYFQQQRRSRGKRDYRGPEEDKK
jgi:Ca-activated chloride channel homolog